LNRLVQELDRSGMTYKSVTFEDLEDLPDANDKSDVIIAAGGDGTMNSVAACCHQKNLRLLPIPTGTANDFCAQLDLYQTTTEVIESLHDIRRDVNIDVVHFSARAKDSSEQGIVLNGMHVGAGAKLLKSL